MTRRLPGDGSSIREKERERKNIIYYIKYGEYYIVLNIVKFFFGTESHKL